MGTNSRDRLSAVLFGRTRCAVLSLLYGRTDEPFYLRQIARTVGAGLGAVQREVKQLSDADVVRRFQRGNQVFYQANPRCPIFAELKSLVAKTAGAGSALRAALAPLAERINLAFVYGSLARKQAHSGSDIDILVVGEASFSEVVSTLGRVQDVLGREINPAVYPADEFRAKLAAGHHFLTTVVKQKKIFLVGDEHELARLAAKRVARPTQKQPRRS